MLVLNLVFLSLTSRLSLVHCLDLDKLGYGRVFGLDIPKYDAIRRRYLNTFSENEEYDDLGRDVVLKKVVGLGAEPSFIGGAFVGVEEESTMAVYFRYLYYKQLIGETGFEFPWPGCKEECAPNSHCSHGFCFCDEGYVLEPGDGCVPEEEIFFKNGTTKNIFIVSSFTQFAPGCDPRNSTKYQCAQFGDINLECTVTNSYNFTDCTCRRGTQWSKISDQCEIYIDVDCSDIGISSTPDSELLDIGRRAVNGELKPDNDVIPNSLLAFLPKDLSKEQYREAFCRDTDAYALALEQKRRTFGASDVINIIFISLGIIGSVVIVLGCIACCICCCCYKKCKDCLNNTFNPDPLKGMSRETRQAGVAMAVLQDEMEEKMDRDRGQTALAYQQPGPQPNYPQYQQQAQAGYPTQKGYQPGYPAQQGYQPTNPGYPTPQGYQPVGQS